MTTQKQPDFQIGERVTIAGLHKQYRPVIVSIETGPRGARFVTVKTPELAGSERVFKFNEIEKITR